MAYDPNVVRAARDRLERRRREAETAAAMEEKKHLLKVLFLSHTSS